MNPQHISKNSKQVETRIPQTDHFQNQALQSQNVTADILHLQRSIGNRATIQRLKQTDESIISSQGNALPFPPSDTSEITDASAQKERMSIQRRIDPLPGTSSGWFRKGRRDKINAMVTAYNQAEAALNNPKAKKPTSQGVQSLVTQIQKIWAAANAWQTAVATKKPQKAADIRQWMTEKVEPERDAKQAQATELQAADARKMAWDAASYNPLCADSRYTTDGNAGTLWLATPSLAPVYEYHIIHNQFDQTTLNAYKDMKQYALNPTRSEALRIYQKYKLETSDELNITGEGVGGVSAINESREPFRRLQARSDAPVPANFGAIEDSIINVINEIFISFRDTDAYKKISTPPEG